MPASRVTLRVIAVISLDTALVSTFHSQPAELELTTGMPSVIRWVCMGCHGTVTGPRAQGSMQILQTTSLLHVTTPAALHATRRTGACTQSQLCPGRATVMLVAAGLQGPGLSGLSAKVQFNKIYNMS